MQTALAPRAFVCRSKHNNQVSRAPVRSLRVQCGAPDGLVRLFKADTEKYAVHLQIVRAAASSDEALKSMQDYQKGLQQRLQDHEQELKTAKSNAASAGGSRFRVAAAAVEAEAGPDLRELSVDDWDSALEEAGDTLVVVDFFTNWCGPCKVMLPMLVKLQEEQPDIKVYKLNCNKKNKELGVKLNVKVAPTFQLYKNSNKVAEMTGAKIDELKSLIQEHK